MKKIFSISLWLLIILAAGCRKDIRDENRETKNPETDLSSAESQERNSGGECRLTVLTYYGGTYQYHYNHKGLADEWDITDYGLFKQEYDHNGRVKKSRLYVSDEIIYSIYFFYNRKGNPVKETWYNGNTNEIYDEVFYSYNQSGQMIKGESFLGDYYTITKYTDEGNVLSWKFYYGGAPFLFGHYSYNRKFKNPYLAVPGIEYGFPFINPTVNFNKWWASGEKLTVFENGNPVVIQDFNPNKTIWQAASHHYPASATYFDRITLGWFPYTFEYENCGHHHNDNRKISTSSSTKTTIDHNISPVKTKLILTFGKTIAEKVLLNKE